MSQDISDPWSVREEGKNACCLGSSRSDNPYLYLSVRWSLWVEGYIWYEVHYRKWAAAGPVDVG
jgi:hypothetical protein